LRITRKNKRREKGRKKERKEERKRSDSSGRVRDGKRLFKKGNITD
jgi:hypothetical protein